MYNVEIKNNGEHSVQENQQETYKKYVTPITDIFEHPENFTIALQVPGIEKENLKIKIENNTLTIKGETQPIADDAKAIMRESCATNYFRKFSLSNTVDVENIKAELKNGILTLTLPKREEAKPRTININ